MTPGARSAVFGACALALGAGAVLLAGRTDTRSARSAEAIVRGMHEADAEADALEASQDEAGYRWAERYSIDKVAACPSYTPRFRQGCEAWVKDEAGR